MALPALVINLSQTDGAVIRSDHFPGALNDEYLISLALAQVSNMRLLWRFIIPSGEYYGLHCNRAQQ